MATQPEEPKFLTFQEVQGATYAWRKKNFPTTADNADHQFMGVVEEVGELAHARLKSLQGIRGTAEEHLANEQDAVGDIVIFLAGYCSARGFNFGSLVEKALREVLERDWINDPHTGGNNAA